MISSLIKYRFRYCRLWLPRDVNYFQPVRPYWTIFERSWKQNFLQNYPKDLVYFVAILKHVTLQVKQLGKPPFRAIFEVVFIAAYYN